MLTIIDEGRLRPQNSADKSVPVGAIAPGRWPPWSGAFPAAERYLTVRGMKRPLHIRVLPDRLKGIAYYLLYKPLPARFKPLLENAPLRFAPGAAMTALVEGDIISDSIALTGFYELELSRGIAKAAAQGGRLVDVGANLGYFSLVWLAARSDNTCISIEASPCNLPLLKQNIEFNGFQDRCRIEGLAAGKERGSLGVKFRLQFLQRRLGRIQSLHKAGAILGNLFRVIRL